jgi:fused signal recognition particle receptor
VDETLLGDLEELLLTADVGVSVSERIVDGVRRRTLQNDRNTLEAVFNSVRKDMLEVLNPVSQALHLPAGRQLPFVILVVGVNGTGKTTTIGKLAHWLKSGGHTVMLAAGDTFRAAAIEQLGSWGERNEVPVIQQHSGADSASVIYDALQAATARGFDVLIADTAGRLHTQTDLMEELKKVRRVINKLDPDAPHEVLLVLDAGTGQNALSQAAQFQQAVGVTGICLTKLDGTAKGGIVLAIADRLGVPIRFVGVGEDIGDFREFNADEFVEALLSH